MSFHTSFLDGDDAKTGIEPKNLLDVSVLKTKVKFPLLFCYNMTPLKFAHFGGAMRDIYGVCHLLLYNYN